MLQRDCRPVFRGSRNRRDLQLRFVAEVYSQSSDRACAMTDGLQELKIFARVAESGSFSHVGEEFGLSQPSVSRIIKELEKRVGVTFFLRSTRRITLTNAGLLFLERIRGILSGLEEAEDAVRELDSLRGSIRLALPVAYGAREIIPRLPEFLFANPLLTITITVSDELQDLVADGVDVAIRQGALRDSAFGARKLTSLPMLLVASPRYLECRGTPRYPGELASHDCIIRAASFARPTWVFRQDSVASAVKVRGRIYCNSGMAIFASALAGMGIARLAIQMVEGEIRAGNLVPLLREYTVDPLDVHAVFPAGRRPSTKVRALVDYLAQKLRDNH